MNSKSSKMASCSFVAGDYVLVEWVEDSTLSVETVKQVRTKSKERPTLDRVYAIEFREANGKIGVYQGKILRIGGKMFKFVVTCKPT